MPIETKKEKRIIRGIERLLLIYTAVMIVVYNNCYLKWDSYGHATVSLVFKLMYHTASVLLMFYALVVRHSRKQLTLSAFFSVLVAVILFIHTNFLGGEYLFQSVIPMLETIIAIIAIFTLDDTKKSVLMEWVIISFALLVLPSMIYFILKNVGINIPYSILASDNPGKVMKNISYMHYPLGLIIKAPWSIARFTGVFDEPGVVGTMAAVFISIGYRRIDRKWIVLLFIEGMLSLSMAFYALLVIFVIVRAFADGALKAAGIIALIVIAFIVFINIPFKNASLRDLQSRIDLSSSFLIEDNRTSNTFDVEYEKFVEEGGYDLMMGKGGTGAYTKNPLMAGSNSYKCLIYDLGIVGFVLYVGFFVIAAFTRRFKKDLLPFYAVFFASIYQRAYVFNVQMAAVFLLGIGYITAVAPDKNLFKHRIRSSDDELAARRWRPVAE